MAIEDPGSNPKADSSETGSTPWADPTAEGLYSLPGDVSVKTTPDDEEQTIHTVPFDKEHHRERWRGKVAAGLLGMLGFIIVGSFVSLWFNWARQTELEALLTIIFAPVIGLVGAVTGFYYGAQSGTPDENPD